MCVGEEGGVHVVVMLCFVQNNELKPPGLLVHNYIALIQFHFSISLLLLFAIVAVHLLQFHFFYFSTVLCDMYGCVYE